MSKTLARLHLDLAYHAKSRGSVIVEANHVGTINFSTNSRAKEGDIHIGKEAWRLKVSNLNSKGMNSNRFPLNNDIGKSDNVSADDVVEGTGLSDFTTIQKSI